MDDLRLSADELAPLEWSSIFLLSRVVIDRFLKKIVHEETLIYAVEVWELLFCSLQSLNFCPGHVKI